MPCRSDYPEFTDSSNQERQKMLKELNLVTRLLCAASALLTKEQIKKLGVDYQGWKTQHDLEDKRRKDQERREKREAILGKQATIEEMEKDIKRLKKEVKDEKKYTSFKG